MQILNEDFSDASLHSENVGSSENSSVDIRPSIEERANGGVASPLKEKASLSTVPSPKPTTPKQRDRASLKDDLAKLCDKMTQIEDSPGKYVSPSKLVVPQTNEHEIKEDAELETFRNSSGVATNSLEESTLEHASTEMDDSSEPATEAEFLQQETMVSESETVEASGIETTTESETVVSDDPTESETVNSEDAPITVSETKTDETQPEERTVETVMEATERRKGSSGRVASLVQSINSKSPATNVKNKASKSSKELDDGIIASIFPQGGSRKVQTVTESSSKSTTSITREDSLQASTATKLDNTNEHEGREIVKDEPSTATSVKDGADGTSESRIAEAKLEKEGGDSTSSLDPKIVANGASAQSQCNDINDSGASALEESMELDDDKRMKKKSKNKKKAEKKRKKKRECLDDDSESGYSLNPQIDLHVSVLGNSSMDLLDNGEGSGDSTYSGDPSTQLDEPESQDKESEAKMEENQSPLATTEQQALRATFAKNTVTQESTIPIESQLNDANALLGVERNEGFPVELCDGPKTVIGAGDEEEEEHAIDKYDDVTVSAKSGQQACEASGAQKMPLQNESPENDEVEVLSEESKERFVGQDDAIKTDELGSEKTSLEPQKRAIGEKSEGLDQVTTEMHPNTMQGPPVNDEVPMSDETEDLVDKHEKKLLEQQKFSARDESELPADGTTTMLESTLQTEFPGHKDENEQSSEPMMKDDSCESTAAENNHKSEAVELDDNEIDKHVKDTVDKARSLEEPNVFEDYGIIASSDNSMRKSFDGHKLDDSMSNENKSEVGAKKKKKKRDRSAKHKKKKKEETEKSSHEDNETNHDIRKQSDQLDSDSLAGRLDASQEVEIGSQSEAAKSLSQTYVSGKGGLARMADQSDPEFQPSTKEPKSKQTPSTKDDAKSEFFDLLNLDPWANDVRLNDERLLEILEEHPKLCKKKYKLEGFNGKVHPLSVLCSLGASPAVVKKCYKAYPDALKDTDDVGSALNYACSYRASLEVVQFITKKAPRSLKEVNIFERLPLHM